MTRKLNVGSFVWLDGVIESPTKIAGSCFDEEVKEYSFQALADVEFLLLGRVAYGMFASRPETKPCSTIAERSPTVRGPPASRRAWRYFRGCCTRSR